MFILSGITILITIICLLFLVKYKNITETFNNNINNNNINNNKKYLSTIYGYQCPNNPNKKYFDILITKWDLISKTYKIPYSLTYGTLLGQVRHRDYIPYDEDIDIHIDKESITNLLNLNIKPWCCFNNEIINHPIEVGTVRLILNKWHNNPFYQRKRYNCQGKLVKNHEDSCSFNGLIARLILKISTNEYKHLDIFVYNYITCPKTQQHLIKENNAIYFKTPYGTYINSNYGTKLPSLKPCYIGNIKSSCFSNSDIFLSTIYGKNYLTPNKKYKNGKWTNNNS